MKYNCTDVTFLFAFRIDSEQRLRNIEAVILYLQQAMDCHFLLLEADREPRGDSLSEIPHVSYSFCKDTQSFFHHTHYRNELIKKASTPILAIWDTDVIAPFIHIREAIDQLRNSPIAVAWPYDGICYSLFQKESEQFSQTKEIQTILSKKDTFPKMFGWLTNGGSFFVKKDLYLRMGMENEYITGWGPEDQERLKRMAILDYPLYRVRGDLFHLWHPRGITSTYATREIKRKNISEYLRVCSLSKEALEQEVRNWPWSNEL